MAQLRPFLGVRPQDALAHDIISPPYDVLSRQEARAILARSPRSFLQVTRPDALLPDDTPAHGTAAYDTARRNLDGMIEDGVLVTDPRPAFHLYSQTWRGRTQTGLMALCSVDEYDAGTIKKHELTRPDKEQDRVDHMQRLDAQVGLVFLAYRDRYPAVTAALSAASTRSAAWRVTTADGVEHALTPVDDPALIDQLVTAFAAVPALYIADGHHRSAAASRVAAARGRAGSSGWFLAGIFPDSQLEVLAYNRVVKDLNGLDTDGFLAALGADFEVSPAEHPVPEQRGTWTMYLGGAWYRVAPRPHAVPTDDPVGSLDVAVIQDRLLGPILGIGNPRTDQRIRFVGGIRGPEALSAAVDSGEEAVAFHMFPTGLDQLFAVADADRLMPPKSTWFEPKLRGGVLLHRITDG